MGDASVQALQRRAALDRLAGSNATARAAASGHLDVLKRVMSPAAPDAIAKSFESRLALADLTGLAERNPAAVLSALDAGKLASFGLDKADMAKVRDVALSARDVGARGTAAATDPQAPVTQIADSGGTENTKRASILVGEGGVNTGEGSAAKASNTESVAIPSRAALGTDKVSGEAQRRITEAKTAFDRILRPEPGSPEAEQAKQAFLELQDGLDKTARLELGRQILQDLLPGPIADLKRRVSEVAPRRAEIRPLSFRNSFVEETLLGQVTVKPIGDMIAGMLAIAGRVPVNPFSGRILSGKAAEDAKILAFTGLGSSAVTGLPGSPVRGDGVCLVSPGGHRVSRPSATSRRRNLWAIGMHGYGIRNRSVQFLRASTRLNR